MIYNDFNGIKLSALGMGTMRFPIIDGINSQIDEAAVIEMVDYAMAQGINYYDTAWGYHDGFSELTTGKALKKYPRDSFYLATKFPGYDLSNMDKISEIFEKQLEKCQVDYFDFYLFHNVCEMNIDAYLDENIGLHKYLMEQKANGKIKHLGFSVHGSYSVMKRFLQAYGKDMEFCQIQLNYLDWSFQDAKSKMDLLKEYNIPVWVMEPLRGGKLTSLSVSDEAKLKALRPDESITAWAFRFLQSLPDVVVSLSGMSNMTQLKENIMTYSEKKQLSQEEISTLLTLASEMTKSTGVPCTACRYCTKDCPKGIDIPNMLSLYNEHSFSGGGFRAPMALQVIPAEKQPSACIKCGRCESVCPQQIKISEALADFVKKLNS